MELSVNYGAFSRKLKCGRCLCIHRREEDYQSVREAKDQFDPALPKAQLIPQVRAVSRLLTPEAPIFAGLAGAHSPGKQTPLTTFYLKENVIHVPDNPFSIGLWRCRHANTGDCQQESIFTLPML